MLDAGCRFAGYRFQNGRSWEDSRGDTAKVDAAVPSGVGRTYAGARGAGDAGWGTASTLSYVPGVFFSLSGID